MNHIQMHAGAGKSIIEFPDGFFPQENFSGIHDDIHVRVVILESNKKIAVVSLELTSLPEQEIDLIKKNVNSATGIETDNIWICVTHSFSSPHFLPSFYDTATEYKMEMLRQAVHRALQSAIRRAKDYMKEAVLGIDSGECDINVNRDVPTAKGWWIGSNPEGYSDKTLTVLKVNEKDAHSDRPIAVLYHYNVQSSVMDGSLSEDGSRSVTSDVTGYASNFIEDAYGSGTIAIFLAGAAGDQAPKKKAKTVEADQVGNLQEKDCHEDGYKIIEELGGVLGQEAVKLAKNIQCDSPGPILTAKKEFLCPGQRMAGDIHSMHPTHTYDYIPEEDRKMSLEGIRIGNIAFLGTRPELNGITARKIIKASAFNHTLIMTMVNGGFKYMADKESYKKITYESMNSPFAKGSAEILIKNAASLLAQMKKQI